LIDSIYISVDYAVIFCIQFTPVNCKKIWIRREEICSDELQAGIKRWVIKHEDNNHFEGEGIKWKTFLSEMDFDYRTYSNTINEKEVH
jgi:hypothetical protein